MNCFVWLLKFTWWMVDGDRKATCETMRLECSILRGFLLPHLQFYHKSTDRLYVVEPRQARLYIMKNCHLTGTTSRVSRSAIRTTQICHQGLLFSLLQPCQTGTWLWSLRLWNAKVTEAIRATAAELMLWELTCGGGVTDSNFFMLLIVDQVTYSLYVNANYWILWEWKVTSNSD
jgi:hypothetical protein